MSRLASRLRSALPPDASDTLETDTSSSGLRVRLRSSSPDRSVEQLNLVLAHVLRDETLDIRRAVAADIEKLEQEAAASATALEAAARDLETARTSSLAGAPTPLPEKIVQTQARLDALSRELDIKTAAREERVKSRAEIARQIETLTSDARNTTALEESIATFKAELATVRSRGIAEVARVEELENNISRADVELSALKVQKETSLSQIQLVLQPILRGLDLELQESAADIDALRQTQLAERSALDTAREELSTLLDANPDFVNRERRWKELAASDRSLRERLQGLRDQMVTGSTDTQAPFAVTERPVLPSRPDGFPAWAVLSAALLAGAVVVLLRLLVGRAPEGVSPDAFGASSRASSDRAEATPGPVSVRWEAVLAAILLAVTVTTSAVFLVLMA